MNHNVRYHSLRVNYFMALALLASLLGGCQILEPVSLSKQAQSNEGERQRDQILRQEDQARLRTIKIHLTLAEQAVEELRLTTPTQGSALHHYKAVLRLQHNHPQAIKGMSDIIDQYLSWALTHIEDDQYSAARRLLDKAYLVDPLAPEVAAMAERLEISRQTKTEIIVLPDWILSEQQEIETAPPEYVLNYFQDIATEIQKKQAAITLYSKHDAQGRWLYRHINEHSENRVRAILKRDTPTRIELHYQPQSDQPQNNQPQNNQPQNNARPLQQGKSGPK